MSAVARLPAADMFAPLATKIDELKLRRGNAIKAAMQRRLMAEQAIDSAKHAGERARQERDLADQELRAQIETGELIVIGDQLVTLNPHGGLIVQHVKVLGLI